VATDLPASYFKILDHNPPALQYLQVPQKSQNAVLELASMESWFVRGLGVLVVLGC